MLRKFTTSYDELIKNYYGDSSRSGLKDTVTIEELYANYYGKAAVSEEERKKKRSATALSFSRDDGEVLVQRPGRRRRSQYGYQQSTDTPDFEEYVVTNDAVETPTSATMSVDPAPADTANIREEYTVDILAPLGDSPATNSKTIPDEYKPSAPPSVPTEERSYQAPEKAELSHAKVTEDDIIGDLEAILKGEKVYDPTSKSTVDRNNLSGAQSTSNRPPVPQAPDSQAIFDRIAQSMTYANAYDLGTVELENRFSDFDRMSDLQQKAAQDRKKRSEFAQSSSVATSPTVGSEHFLEDLDAIRRQQERGGPSVSIAEAMSTVTVEEMDQSGRDPVCRPWALSLSASDDLAQYSRPLYESGEHVQTGWDLYTDQLRVGKAPGLMFSYGELIAMGDLYEDVEQMLEAPVSELKSVKNLLAYDRRYYAGHRKDKSLKVWDENWKNVIGQRYIDLADDNYSHFAPNYLFPNEPWSGNCGKRDNKIYWQRNHRNAILEAQKIRQSAGAGAKPFLEKALIINAFGDHFLTDAFSAGHTISKEATVEMFKHNFYDGEDLKPVAEKFIERVAEKAFVDEVKDKFSKLETYGPLLPVLIEWHPNIDTVDMFTRVLKGIAEKAPASIANIAVLILHDDLNEQGVWVTNDFITKPWKLAGDALLNDENLEIIKQAVQQSVDNVNDPANNASNISAAFERVWRHVPRLTDASKALVKELSREYTNPNSDLLVNKTAAKIHQRVDLLIQKLLDPKAKALRPE